jgi:molybdopterin-guanine dinucleotide biosynthesis protein A
MLPVPPADRTQPIAREQITGVVLAGGRGTRMGGADKGLVLFDGRPMVEHVIARLRPQVGSLFINANRNRDLYASFGYPVIADLVGGYLGPLAGIAAGLSAATTPFVVTAPCDSPLVAADLVARLGDALVREDAELAVADDGERQHPVFLLLRRELLPSLLAFLDAGERKIDRWFARHRVATASFRDEPEGFVNVNDAAERAALEARLHSGGC